jgi:Rv0078B-related antitoxin
MSSENDSVQGLRLAFELFDAAESLMRQNIRRSFPESTEQEIEAKIIAWLQDRPGAPHGDYSAT